MGDLYIQGYHFLSIQPTFDENFEFEKEDLQRYDHGAIPIINPDYKEIIPALQLRRMNKSMRMALYAGTKALEKAKASATSAIIVGTGLGCLKDSERFVATLLEDESQLFNPTPFIQSTHNMSAATLAIALNCKGYNMTYVNSSHSFESAILDARLYLSEHPEQSILVGGVDEIGERTPMFWELYGYSSVDNPEIPTKPSSSKGEVNAEGCAFFVMGANKTENSIAMLEGTAVELDVDQENPQKFLQNFLDAKNLTARDIDLVILGYNGDNRYDGVYDTIANVIFPEQTIAGYKHIFGEFDTVSSLGVALACRIFERNQIPPGAILRDSGLKRPPNKHINRVLIYQQRRNEFASIHLMKNVLPQ